MYILLFTGKVPGGHPNLYTVKVKCIQNSHCSLDDSTIFTQQLFSVLLTFRQAAQSNTYSFWKKTSVTIIIASQVLPLRLVCRVQETEPERSGVRKANVQRYFRIPGGCAFDSSSIQCSSVHDYSCSTEQHYLRNTCL